MLRPFNQEHCIGVTIESKMNFPFLASRLPWLFQFAASGTHFAYWTSQAHWFSRQTHGRPQFHHGLVKIARPEGAQQFLRSQPQRLLWKSLSNHALKHSLDVSIHDCGWFVERDAGDCRRCVAADSRKCAQISRAPKKCSRMLLDDFFSRRVQHAGT